MREEGVGAGHRARAGELGYGGGSQGGEAFKVAAQAGGVGAARRQRDFEEFQVEHGT